MMMHTTRRASAAAFAAARRPASKATVRRQMMSKSQAPKFDPVMAAAYNVMSENHRHERGPWTLMTNHAILHASGIDNPNILDIATGPGEPAKSIALGLPHANVIASDVSEDMVAAATKNTEGVANLKCVLADVQDLSSLESNSIDIVTCCYGYMFPTDKSAALAETHRVLKPGGTLIATSWDALDLLKLCKDVMKSVVGHDSPPPPLNPMSLSEEGLFHKLVDDVGFINIEQSTSTYPFNLGADKEFQFTASTLLLREKINEIAETDDKVWVRAEESFWENVGKYAMMEDGEMVIPENTFRLTIAKKA